MDMKVQGKRVLIVDDEDMLAENLTAYLRRFGCDVQVAPSGGDAVALSETFTPEMIFLDYNLPDMSGFQALNLMRRRFPQDPLSYGCVLMTGHPTDTVLSDARHNGIRRFLFKPFPLSELDACLRAEPDEVGLGPVVPKLEDDRRQVERRSFLSRIVFPLRRANGEWVVEDQRRGDPHKSDQRLDDHQGDRRNRDRRNRDRY